MLRLKGQHLQCRLMQRLVWVLPLLLTVWWVLPVLATQVPHENVPASTRGIATDIGGCPHDGDVNMNGTITPADALLAFLHFLNPTTSGLNNCQRDHADVQAPGSNAITPDDARCIFQRYLGLPSCLPVITPPGAQTAVEGASVDLASAATPAAGRTLSFSATGLPPNLLIDPTTGRITGIVAAGAATTNPYNVVVDVSDGVLRARLAFTWTVAAPTLRPGPCLCAGEEEKPITVSVAVTGATSTMGALLRLGQQGFAVAAQDLPANTSHAAGVQVTFRLPDDEGNENEPNPGRFIDDNGQPVTSITVRTNAEGIAEAMFQIGSERVRVMGANLTNDPDSQPVRFTVTLGLPSGITVDAIDRLAVVDAGLKAVVRLDPVSNERIVISGCADAACSRLIGNGPAFGIPYAIAFEPQRNTLVVIDFAVPVANDVSSPAVVRVDPRTGDRTVLSSNRISDNNVVFFGAPVGIAVEADGSLVVVDRFAFDSLGVFSQAVLRVNPVTGERKVVSSFFTFFNDVFFGFPYDIAVEANGTLVVVDTNAFDSTGRVSQAILRVDPNTGHRTVVSSNFNIDDLGFGTPVGIAVEANGNLVVVDIATPDRTPEFAGFFTPAVVRVNPRTGDRSVISSNFFSDSDVLLRFPYSITVQRGGTLALVDVGDETALPRVVRVDPQTGALTVVGDNDDRRGNGPRFDIPKDIAAETNGTLWVLEAEPDNFGATTAPRVVRVDSTTGDRTEVSSNTRPSTDDVFFGAPVGIVVQENGNVWVLDNAALDRFNGNIGPAVLQINRSTGDRTVRASNGPGIAFFGNLVDLAVQANGLLWVLDTNAILLNNSNQFDNIGPTVWLVDPSTGNRNVLVSNGLGTARFGTPAGIAITANGEIGWVVDNIPAVWQVERQSGAVSLFASNGAGNAFFSNLIDIALVEATGELFVLDESAFDLFGFRSPAVFAVSQVDPITSVRFLISSNGVSAGFFARPTGMTVADANSLVVVDQRLETVMRVDLLSGTRTIISK